MCLYYFGKMMCLYMLICRLNDMFDYIRIIEYLDSQLRFELSVGSFWIIK